MAIFLAALIGALVGVVADELLGAKVVSEVKHELASLKAWGEAKVESVKADLVAELGKLQKKL